MGRRPDFLIIGAMKCGTSTLHEQLGLQPGIFTPELKEPGYFSHPEVYARGANWYAELFAPARPGDLCGESSTHYTKLPVFTGCVERIKRDLGEVKLIYMMRNPLDRVVSQYVHSWTLGEIREPLDGAIERHPEIADYGRYAMQLEPYLEAFGREAVLPVFLERMQAEPQGELERICRFLGLASQPRWNRENARLNATSDRMRPNALRDAVVTAPILRSLRQRLLPAAVRDRLKAWWRLEESPTLGEARRRELEALYDEDLARLGGWLGVELGCARFGETVSRASLEWAAP